VLKTKDITFFEAENYARFARKSALIADQIEQKRQDLRKTNRSLEAGERR